MRSLLTLLSLLVACDPDTSVIKQPIDGDGDGYTDDVDCDDAHATVNPDAEEVCDGLDNDCDGTPDNNASDALPWRADEDGDGFGNPNATTLACEAPEGTVEDATDCDDTNADAFPGNPEVCDGVDNDCNGAVDDNAGDFATYYTDADGDGYGDPATGVEACAPGTNEVADGTDCDDENPAIHPEAPETDCTDPVDYNCDGSIGYADLDGDGSPACEDCDDGDAARSPNLEEICDEANVDEDCDGSSDDDDSSVTGAPTWYRDIDGDGYSGGTGASLVQCEQPAGYAAVTGDCDDYDSSANPGEVEICDALNTDEDCDGLTDDNDPSTSAASWNTWYADRDGDGYGDASRTVSQCEAPANYVANDDDCDDTSAARNPGATEVCDAADLDEDCDGLSDDADPSVTGGTTYYRDADGDGYGGTSTVQACAVPTGYVTNDDDCNDANADISPGDIEVCDAANTDEDCDGLADDFDSGASGKTAWYRDADGDGHAGTTTTVACDQPTGYLPTATDCNDASAAISPSATEVCDAANVDEDCDGLADDADASATGKSTWYRDADGDGYAGSTSMSACDQPTGYLATSTDCNDSNAAVSPGAPEVCDAADTDEDCDGLADNADPSATGTTTWYRDADSDTYGNAAVTTATCDAPTGYVANGDDCDDGSGSITTARVWYRDADSDGYGLSTSTVTACTQPTGYVSNATDCNDASASVNPAATEVCDAANVDEDCDGTADDADASVSGKTTWYRDADSDGYGTAGTTMASCETVTGYVTNDDDCNDGSAAVSPGATEVCDASNVDEDCDGVADDADASATGKTTWYRDADSDTYGNASVSTSTCDAPAGYVSNGSDCDDTSSAIGSNRTWYRDADSDGYGVSSTTAASCTQPAGYVSTAGDCNDASAAISPAATEVCDASNVDEDCDGAADDSDTSATGKTVWYRDADSDGYGNASVTVAACDSVSGYVSNSTDCNDGNAAISPGDPEVCDASDVDEDCDGLADDADPSATGKTSWYLDGDGDGYGTSATSVSLCNQPTGYVSVSTDCDDGESTAHPGGTEVCDDDIDQDCSGADEECEPGGYSGTYAVNTGYDVKIYGTTANDYFGYPLVAGDFNGDGDGDLIVNASGEQYPSASYDSIVYGFYGPFPSGVSTAQSVDDFLFYNNSSSASGWYGQQLYNVGDINSDGKQDFLARLNSSMSHYMYYGGDTGTATYSAYDDNSFTCTAASSAGDFDSPTGADDWICGLSTASTSKGTAYIYAGTSTSTTANFPGETNYDYAGAAVAGGGDVNGDGYDDIWVGAYGADDGGSEAGAAYLVYAPVTGTFNLVGADVKLKGGAATDYFGYSLTMPGDIDGDGYDDIIAGAYGQDSGGSAAGALYVVTNPSSGTAATRSEAIILGEDANDQIGLVAASAGDVDGDGQIDLLVGSARNDDNGGDAGAVWLVYGPLVGTIDLESAADAKWLGTNASDNLGASFAIMPDTNDDGKDEIVMAATNGDERGYINHGAIWIWYGE